TVVALAARDSSARSSADRPRRRWSFAARSALLPFSKLARSRRCGGYEASKPSAISASPECRATSGGDPAAAASGSPPLVARHSGLAEIALGLEASYPPHLRDLASFENGNSADLAAKLHRLLGLSADDRAELSRAARATT